MQSVIHPLTKLLAVVLITTFAVVQPNLLLLTADICFCLILLLLSKQSGSDAKRLWKSIFHFLPVVISIFLLQVIFTRKGTAIFSYGILKITREGLNTSVRVSLRLLILLLAGAWLWHLSTRDFRQAFRTLHIPETITVMLMLTLRFLPMLSEKIKQSLLQLRLRGIIMKDISYGKRLIVYKSLMLTILGWTLRELDFQAIALDARGFRNGQKHTFYQQRNLAATDFLVIGSLLVLFALPWIL
ncbi:MAG TPA: energy-coupling factor transporter transmembrane component T [Candidatus Cloacimonadota bacterium]|nr:energy-coupling factor transporter transmembrane component T [Candidatus Cloacimonadota bacterium]HQL14761.1 energy-coupling factor transporter transmembrane component T [Candidatus Cloacimonadota bacterium]